MGNLWGPTAIQGTKAGGEFQELYLASLKVQFENNPGRLAKLSKVSYLNYKKLTGIWVNGYLKDNGQLNSVYTAGGSGARL